MYLKTTTSRLLVAFIFVLIAQTMQAQNVQDNQKAMALVKKNAAALGLSNDNILNSRIADTYTDALSGATLVYLQQIQTGYDVDKSVMVLAFKNGLPVSQAGKLITSPFKKTVAMDAMQKKAAIPAITATNAILAATQYLHLAAPSLNTAINSVQDFSKPVNFGNLDIAKEDVTVRLLWLPQQAFTGFKLVWEVNISPKKTADSWRIMVDAKTGSIVKQENYTKHNDWSKLLNAQNASENKIAYNRPSALNNTGKAAQQSFTSTTYRVVPFPAEAPTFPGGNPALVTDPWKLSPQGSGATPFMWNDDGSLQYKYTKGNNAIAQEDVNGDDGGGKRAKGITSGNNLYFDYQPNFNAQPTDSLNQGFAITNLFYWNNIMHDLSYQYGFDEVSGNFQQNNLGRGGKGYDYVYADAQDGSYFNSANFSTPPDGQKPRMQIFLWSARSDKGVTINEPSSIAGNVQSVESIFSPNNLLKDVGPVTGDVVLYDDVADTGHNACSPPANAAELSGKIVLIDRFSCDFTFKTLNAQNAGALAVIITDDIPGEAPFVMNGDEPSITIPAVLISYEDGLKIKDQLYNGITVNVTLTAVPYVDADLDNGIICYEYAQGIATRLTGGPSNVTCLFNLEQMIGGSSEYLALMTTTDWSKAHKNDGAKARPFATYALNQPPNGAGIRTYPYSTDMTIDPHTYADLGNGNASFDYSGEVWATVLWDMTWFIINDEGINKDIFNARGEGGNTVAYKLVMEGMKLQPCSPGFIDGRDAILKADTLLYGGRHSCAIWKAFARRGMGVGASQGSSGLVGDEVVDFKESAVFITKHAGKSTAPGKTINYTIGLRAKAVCYGSVMPNYSVTDSLPSNVTYVSSDGTYNPSNKTITFSNINMNGGDSLTLNVKVKVNNNAYFPDSVYLYDPVTTPYITDQWIAHNGKYMEWSAHYYDVDYYYSGDTSTKDNENLETAEKYIIPGEKTTFSFFNYVASNDYNNGGVLEIKVDKEDNWRDLGPYMDSSGFTYNETITGNSVLHGRRAFAGFGYGNTIIDLSSFAGKKVKIRFRYATSDSSFASPNDASTGWVFNNIVLSASAKVTNTAKLYDKFNAGKGLSTVVTTIKPGNNTDVADAKATELSNAIHVFPNPARDKVNVYIPGNEATVKIQLTDALGKQIKTYDAGGANIELKLPILAHGVYYLNIIKVNGTSKQKLVIE